MRMSVLALCATAVVRAQTGETFFEKNVRPLFLAKCNGCHAGAAPAGGLKLDSREAVLKGGARGAAIVAGKPADSLLIRVVRHMEGNLKMPPGPKLPDAEAALLAQWVEMGAPWGKSAEPAPAGGKFWSFIPAAEPKIPAVKNPSWVRNPVDAFVLAKLEEKGLRPAPPADKRSLIRRATYDLIGLPPTPEEIQAFLDDNSPNAFEKVVKRLLASPRYGERWARHWLDVARYADSNGLDENLVYKNAFRYRDYVIAAFNKDKPYDQFVREQIAGDLLPESPALDTQFERWTATGFLSLGAKMLAEDDPVKMEMDIIDEQLDTIGRTFMGLTLGCARCHDHKFDPIPAKDYYGMAGILKSTKTMENFKVVAKWHEYVLAPKEDRDRLAAHEARIEAKTKEAGKISGAENRKLTAEAKGNVGAYLMAAHETMLAGKTALKPLPAGATVLVEREGSSFDAGNASKPLEPKKPNTEKDAKGPFFAEFKIEAPRDAEYQLELLDEERGGGTHDLHINGEMVKAGLPPVQNREASPDDGGWSPLGIFTLRSGSNTIRLQHKNRFPYFAKLRVAPSPLPAGTPVPRTAVQIARKHRVNPSFVEQFVEHIERSNGAAASALYAFETFGKQRPPGEWASPAAKLFEGFQSKSIEDVANRYQELFLKAMESREAKDAPLDALKEFLDEKFGPLRAPGNARDYYPAEAVAALVKIEEEQKLLEKETPDYPRAMGVRESAKITDLPIHIRGSHWTLGDKAPRGFLTVIAGDRPALPADVSGRLEFANWMTSKDHPLTARVMANRLWRWHFGRGIVPSTDNFGRLGERPTNQPLLDWLALRFVEKGWSVKSMHETIMLSNAYRMSSGYDSAAFEADPGNALLWRFNRRRLEAEAIRDGIMSVSGGLKLDMGGTILSYKDRQYVANTSKRGGVDYERDIRAVYIPVVRSSMYEVFTAFDLPDPAVPQGDRDSTIVAPQALFMLNGAVVLKHSRRMADMLLALSGSDADRIRAAYERSFSRPASDKEVEQALGFLERIGKVLPADSKDKRALAWQSLCKALIASNEFIYLN